MLVHSIPSGVLNIGRYVDPAVSIASWVQQLGNRRVPESMQSLSAGRKNILFVKVHEAGAPAPEEDWLRGNAVVVEEKNVGLAAIVQFQPKQVGTFEPATSKY